MGRGGRSGGRTPRRLGLIGTLGRPVSALVALGLFFLCLAAVSLWSWRTFASSQGFADVATDMLKEPKVREAVAQQIVTALEDQAATSRTAVNARPLMEQVVAEVVATDAFQGIFHAGVRQLHAAVMQGHRSRLLVRVDDAAQLVKDGLRVLNPTLADAIPDSALEVLVGVSQSTPADQVMRVSSLAGWLAGPFFAISLMCFVRAVRRSGDRRRVVETIGWSLVAVGVVSFALLAVALNVFAGLGDDPRQRTALRAVFWSTTHLLNIQAKVLITAGTVIAVAAAYSGTGGARERARVVWRSALARLTEPQWKAAFSLALIAVSVGAILWPELAATVIVRVVAFAGLVVGFVGLLDLVGSYRWEVTGSAAIQRAARRLAFDLTGGVAVCSAVLLFGGMAFAKNVRAPSVGRPDIEVTGCNGHVELCDRPLDEVAFAGTHNAMSASAERGWLFARQTGGIGAQLARGVRALLVDLHYGAQVADLVRTDFRTEGARQLAAGTLSEKERAATERLLGILGAAPSDRRREVFLCHGYCELGATRAVDAFRLVHDFLRENPNEVVLLLLEDHVAAADAMDVLEQAGLADRAWRWEPGTELPTLREMITGGRNVLVMAEHEGGASPWYLDAYGGLLQDTPFHFDTARDFSCRSGRGDRDSPLLLVNHWLASDPPDPQDAESVNVASVLGERTEECAEERGQPVNIVAVDFYNRGDLFEVVDDLNGVGGDRTFLQAAAES